MVINENGLITENQNTQDVKLTNTEDFEINNGLEKNFDLNSNEKSEISIENVKDEKSSVFSDNGLANSTITLDDSFVDPIKDCFESDELAKSTNQTDLCEPIELTEQTNTAEPKETAETNCLALTVRKNYNLSIVKNGIFTTLRMSWKVALSTFILNVLKLFF